MFPLLIPAWGAAVSADGKVLLTLMCSCNVDVDSCCYCLWLYNVLVILARTYAPSWDDRNIFSKFFLSITQFNFPLHEGNWGIVLVFSCLKKKKKGVWKQGHMDGWQWRSREQALFPSFAHILPARLRCQCSYSVWQWGILSLLFKLSKRIYEREGTSQINRALPATLCVTRWFLTWKQAVICIQY